MVFPSAKGVVLPFGKNAHSTRDTLCVKAQAVQWERLATQSVAFFGDAALLRHFFIAEEITMNCYKDLYYKLFAVMADAVESLENNEPIAAKKVLLAAMRDAEEIVISAED